MSIGLGLICKNEELVIATCLSSHLPYVDYICVIDTGSSDSTLAQATAILRESGKPFHIEVHNIKPFNFAAARNLYVDFLNDKVDWILATDADDELPQSSGNDMRAWSASDYDVFSINYVTGVDTSHVHHRLFRTKMDIRYAGAVHEYLVLGNNHKYKHLDIPVMHKPKDPNHYVDSTKRNLEILNTETRLTPRDMFYKAQTLKDLGKHAEAIECYGNYLKSNSNYLDERLHAYWYKAYLERITGKKDEAIKTIKEGIALDPSFADLQMELAWASEDKNERYAACLKAAATPFRKRLFNLAGNYKDGAYSRDLLKTLTGVKP